MNKHLTHEDLGITNVGWASKEDFVRVLRFFYNIEYDRFLTLIGAVGQDDAWGNEQWDGMKSNFIYWFCNLDSDFQDRLLTAALN